MMGPEETEEQNRWLQEELRPGIKQRWSREDWGRWHGMSAERQQAYVNQQWEIYKVMRNLVYPSQGAEPVSNVVDNSNSTQKSSYQSEGKTVWSQYQLRDLRITPRASPSDYALPDLQGLRVPRNLQSGIDWARSGKAEPTGFLAGTGIALEDVAANLHGRLEKTEEGMFLHFDPIAINSAN